MEIHNKIEVTAPITVDAEVETYAREKASVLAFPEEKQGDLQYIRSIMVSAGTNKNGAHFLPSEMMQAQETVVHKAIDIEHEEDKVIGHIYDCAFLFKDGDQFDPKLLLADYAELARDPNEVDIDIAVAGIIHKARFPQYAEEIAAGDWKVSMECYFRDFDLKIGSQIITRDEAKALGYNPDDMLGGFVKVAAGNKVLGRHMVARVLRGITFSGMGIVKNPANPHSIILETAAHREMMSKGSDLIIDLESIDNMRGYKINISSEAAATQIDNKAKVADNLIEINPHVDEATAQEQIYVELDRESGGIKRILSVGGKEDAALRWSGPGIGGPGSITSWPDSICKSFKKRATKFNALDQSEAVVVHEHWCALFEEACPVIGASSKAPECLRNQLNRTTRNADDNTLTKSVREHLNSAPGNTYTTTLTQEISSLQKERKEQILRMRSQAVELQDKLREFVAAQKKTSKS